MKINRRQLRRLINEQLDNLKIKYVPSKSDIERRYKEVQGEIPSDLDSDVNKLMQGVADGKTADELLDLMSQLISVGVTSTTMNMISDLELTRRLSLKHNKTVDAVANLIKRVSKLEADMTKNVAANKPSRQALIKKYGKGGTNEIDLDIDDLDSDEI